MIAEVEEYLKKKYGQNYQSDAQQKYDETVNDNNTASLFANLGDVVAKRNVGSADAHFKNLNDQAKADTLGKIEKDKASFAEDYDLSRKMAQNKITDEQRTRDMDVNSDESKMARSLAISMGMSPDKVASMSAAKFKELSPVLQKKYEIEQSKLSRADAREQRNFEREQKLTEKREKEAKPSEKQIEAFTDFDNAESDLNNILASLGKNSNWTGKVDGLIPDMLVGDDQVAWRSAVGKYKDAYRKAITGAGAGPTEIAMLEQRLPSEYDTFENFKAKSNEAIKELHRRRSILADNLTKGGKDVSQFAKNPERKKNVVKRQVNQKTGQTRLVYDDGSTEIVNQLAGG